jgi:hypothetical protein
MHHNPAGHDTASSMEIKPMKQMSGSTKPVPAIEPEPTAPLLGSAQRFVQIPFDLETLEEKGDEPCDRS